MNTFNQILEQQLYSDVPVNLKTNRKLTESEWEQLKEEHDLGTYGISEQGLLFKGWNKISEAEKWKTISNHAGQLLNILPINID